MSEIPNTQETNENERPPITPDEARDVGALLHKAVRLSHEELTDDQVYDHLARDISSTVYQTEVHNTFPGTHDLYSAARAGLFDPTIGDPKKILDPLKVTGRVSLETIDGIQKSVDARAATRAGGASDEEMARFETTEADQLLGRINGVGQGDPREMAVAYAYVGGLYAAHGVDPYNASQVAQVTGLIEQQAALPNGQ
jgi:hypothetical protein